MTALVSATHLPDLRSRAALPVPPGISPEEWKRPLCEWRLENLYVVDSETGCWNWRWRREKGYGTITAAGHNYRAHRFVYEKLRGPIPKGFHLHHVCENKACVNPEHLEPKAPGVHLGEHHRARISTLTKDDVVALRVRAAAGESVSALARERGLSAQHIWDVVTGRRWPEVGGPTQAPERFCGWCGAKLHKARTARYCNPNCRSSASYHRRRKQRQEAA